MVGTNKKSPQRAPGAKWLVLAKLVKGVVKKVADIHPPVLGGPLDSDFSTEEFASLLSENPNFEQLATTGILIVPEIYQIRPIVPGDRTRLAARLTIEGIGSSPVKAASNFLLGSDTAEVRTLTNQVNSFFEDRKVFPWESVGDRLFDEERGIFIRMRDGKWRVIERIPMVSLRKKAYSRYISVRQRSLTRSEGISKALETQSYYERIGKEYLEEFRRQDVSAKFELALQKRKMAIRELERAQAAYEAANQYSSVASGIAFLASVFSIASSVSKISEKSQLRDEGNSELERAKLLEKEARDLRNSSAREANETSEDLSDVIQKALPAADPPKEKVPIIQEPIDIGDPT